VNITLHYFLATKYFVLIILHTYLGLCLKFTIFLIEFSHIWTFWDDLLKRPQYQVTQLLHQSLHIYKMYKIGNAEQARMNNNFKTTRHAATTPNLYNAINL